jgi:hypothetical protein
MTADKDSWKREPFTGGLPIPFQATFSPTELSRLRKGLIPKSMDDKWFIYFESPYLYLHRSWTGKLIYRVEPRMVVRALLSWSAFPILKRSIAWGLIFKRLWSML